MFVVPSDVHGTTLKPELISYVEGKVKKPIRKAKINLPPGLKIPSVSVKIDRPRFANPTHNPPCIEKILLKRKEMLQKAIHVNENHSSSSEDENSNQNLF